MATPPHIAPAELPAPYVAAAQAMRRDDFPAARAELEPLTRGEGPAARRARLVLGLQAHAAEEVELAERLLYSAAGDPTGGLEDWRLFVLADCAAARDHLPAAESALVLLLRDHSDSPLRGRALARAATIAHQAGQDDQALSMIRAAETEELDDATIGRLDSLAWEIGRSGGRPAVAEEAARRLLTHSPLEASKLHVVEIFRQPDGRVDWNRLFSRRELERRARRLLDLGIPDGALTTLETIPPSARDLGWSLLAAEAHTAQHEGRQALRILADARATDPASRVRLAWRHAEAADEAAEVRRGRPTPSAAERARLRGEAIDDLRLIVELGTDPLTSIRALRRLFVELSGDDLFDQAIGVLHHLHDLAPGDTTGASNLWQRGWAEYQNGNFSGAIGYWSELEGLYPTSGLARSGRYWTARAYERLGDGGRAHEIYREIAGSATHDFYREHAIGRLGETALATDASPPEPVTEPWPSDPSLARAELLSNLGLDHLALSELDARRSRAEERAWHALEGVVLARQGQRRASIDELRAAFPQLGGPYQATAPERALRLYYPVDYLETVQRWARAHDLPSHLVLGLIRQESAFDAHARSWAGARGLMQMMPATGRELARRLGLRYSTARLSDPDFNVRLGTAYLDHVLDLFAGDVELALAGYNAGPYRIRRLWREAGPHAEVDSFLEGLSPDEPRVYVKRILVLADSYRRLYPEVG